MTKKQDGQDSDSDVLCSVQASIDRYVCERGYAHSVLKSREFSSSKAVSIGKVQFIRKDGKGRGPNKSRSLILSS